MTRFTRRQALAATAAMPVAAGLATQGHAAAEMKGASSARFNRFKLGGFEVTALLGGTATRDEPQGIFGMNVSSEDFAEVSAENFIPTDKTQFFFTPTLVNTGSELILFDTGLNAAATTDVIGAAGYSPDQVDTVVLTHMHGDHIGGLTGDAGETFTNARYVTGSTEHNHWSGAGSDGFDAKVAPLNDKMTFLEDGGSVASGVTAMAAFGHTPGHMGYMLESDGQQLMLFADLANHYVWSLAYPDWEVLFDMDKAAAAATRRRVLSMLATDKVPFIGYHMPFPAMGYVETRGDGFRYVPASYQMMMG
ncbi:MBL fold metallo-hydrolase [Meridianimarinicoccus aquatilis]|uniref:MBL fold metallo-hydrolase n=1 Tax=Meridianimarinicoccus aquatilis TaxID=2552766 RepID=A0A4V3BCJ4_9RHOB|nr:MBL fold metallo-hydrolase [Fluviibacterium aquatile]QIE40582.1 MBL fold metallo-hydrolase [Rhodobacteraceae bacterium SC52]TDL91089.1 MBL fold metallo-hydrolase [Fluviibacterium aquatile]